MYPPKHFGSGVRRETCAARAHSFTDASTMLRPEFVLLILVCPAQAQQGGNSACQGKGYNEVQCSEVGCCYFDHSLSRCKSAVGASACAVNDGRSMCEGHEHSNDACGAIGCCYVAAATTVVTTPAVSGVVGSLKGAITVGVDECMSAVETSPCANNDGVSMCEGHGHSESVCTAIGCCTYTRVSLRPPLPIPLPLPLPYTMPHHTTPHHTTPTRPTHPTPISPRPIPLHSRPRLM